MGRKTGEAETGTGGREGEMGEAEATEGMLAAEACIIGMLAAEACIPSSIAAR